MTEHSSTEIGSRILDLVIVFYIVRQRYDRDINNVFRFGSRIFNVRKSVDLYLYQCLRSLDRYLVQWEFLRFRFLIYPDVYY